MQFYRVVGVSHDEKWVEDYDNRLVVRDTTRKIQRKSEEFNQQFQKKEIFFVSQIDDGAVSLGIVCQKRAGLEKKIDKFLKAIELPIQVEEMEEVTFSTFNDCLEDASRYGFIKDDDEVLEQFNLEKLKRRYNQSFSMGENLIAETDKKTIYEKATNYLSNETILPELDRIYSQKAKANVVGHPVHYLVQTDDREIRKGMYQLILQALYENGRLQNKRYSFLDVVNEDSFSKSSLNYIYQSCVGGALVVRFMFTEEQEDDHARSSRNIVETFCESMKLYRNQVLTIFCLPRECTSIKEMFYEQIGNTGLIEIKEEFVCGERAMTFLKTIAKETGVRTDKKLFEKLEEGKGYLAPELHMLFEEWYNEKLKTTIYPQYKELVTAKKIIQKASPKGTAYDELMEMIGLSDAKKVIKQALNYFKAQKLFADKGMKVDRPAMHMVFTGNPGTAKTSVARLFAQIMRENDLVTKGTFIEVGRGDLVGKYVGWTAPTIKRKFREAEGGVLFIDEAYSLVDDRDGSFGDEAINTIVQEMENHRDDVVVIFAGYSDKMEKFLKKNPGLRSRIAYHVPFVDYDTDELCEIANLTAKKKGLTLSEGAKKKLKVVFESVKGQTDFGNGRYVRNVLEKAKMAQADRLVQMDFDSIQPGDITTICEEDVELPNNQKVEKKRKIGFIA